MFYFGITLGRILNGFVADKFGDKTMIRVGSAVLVLGLILVALPLKTNAFCIAGLLVIGLGCAPIYPCIIHSTPDNFGADKSQAIVGVQMASAYTGNLLMPPLFGLIANHISAGLFPLYMLLILCVMWVMHVQLQKRVKKEA